MSSKNVNNKKCAPKIIFFNEKKIRNIRMIFVIGNRLRGMPYHELPN